MKTIANIFEGIFDTDDDELWWNGRDKLPGNDDDRKIYPGEDGTLGTSDDYYEDKDEKGTTHIPDIRCITSKSRIELMSLLDRYAPLIDGHKLAPKISAPIMAWARRIRNISLETPVPRAEIEIRGLEEAENVTFKTKKLFLMHLTHMPIFNNVRANDVRHIQFDFATVKDLEHTFLPDIIDWEGTIDALGARSAKIPPYDLGKLYKRMGGNRVSYIFTNSMRFRSGIDLAKCIKDLPLPNLESVSIDFNGIQLTITKNISGVTNPIPDSKLGYVLN